MATTGSQGVNSIGSPRQPNTNTFTIAPNLADIDLADTYTQLLDETNTSLNSIFTSDGVSQTEIQAAMDYRNSFKQGDVISALSGFYVNLTENYFSSPDFSLDAVLYWYQRLKYSNKEISSYKSGASFYNQNVLTNQIPGAAKFAQNTVNNFHIGSDGYFDIASDSLGGITNSKFIQLDSTLPLFDVGQQYYGVPIPFAASMDNKISAITRNVAYNLSKKTTIFMKRNLLNVGYTNTALQQNLAADSTTSHGLNLINDLPTFVNINKFLGQLKDRLASVFTQAKLFSFVQYLNTIGNTSAMNLRDIFPPDPTDVDFTVITSEENAAASIAIAQQEQIDAAAAATLAHQQNTSAFSGNPATSNNGTSIGSADKAAGNQFAKGEGNPLAIADTTGSAIAARNAAMDATGMTIDTWTDSKGNVIASQSSFEAYCVQRLSGPPASPLLTLNPSDAANYGITDSSDPKQWANFMWRTACAENGDIGAPTVKVTQYQTGPDDPGGSFGMLSVSPAQAKAFGYAGATPDSLQNPALNVNVGISLVEKSTAKTGTIGGNYVRNGGAFAGRTMNLLKT